MCKIFYKTHKKRLLFSFLLGIMGELSLRERKQDATVAQSVEQLIRNQQVAGSSPASSSKHRLACSQKEKRKILVFLFSFLLFALYALLSNEQNSLKLWFGVAS